MTPLDTLLETSGQSETMLWGKNSLIIRHYDKSSLLCGSRTRQFKPKQDFFPHPKQVIFVR